MDTFFDFIRVIATPNFDYNTRVVLVGVIVYSVGCAMIGNFMILQKRSLLADVLSHATFPGIILIFIFMVLIGSVVYSKNIAILMIGAVGTTLMAVIIMLVLQKHTILKPDAIQASILSLFFGMGVALLGLAQRMPSGSTAGMFTYIYGNTASMQRNDSLLFIGGSFFVLCFILFRKRQLTILSFDIEYANSLGIRTVLLDLTVLVIIVLQVIIGIQAIGLLMVSALFIVPVVVARFWSEKLHSLIWISVVVGIISGYIGALISANSTRFPTGAVIVLVMEMFFIVSLFFGSKKGIVTKSIEKRKFTTKMQIEHTLRLIYEELELIKDSGENRKYITIETLSNYSGIAISRVHRRILYMERLGLLILLGNSIELSSHGQQESKRIIRNHRLWEIYLLHYTDASSETVDYSADRVEHILGDDLTHILEETLEEEYKNQGYLTKVVSSPHKLKETHI